MADWIPSSKPAWWGTVEEFATGPRVFILSNVVTWFVDVVLNATDVYSNTVIRLSNLIISVVIDPLSVAFDPFEIGGDLIMLLVRELSREMLSLASLTGPFAPFVIYPMWVVIAFVTGWLLLKAGRILVFAVVTRL